MAEWRELAAVAAGGVVGTGIRLTLDTVIPHSDTEFPLSTLIINIVGSFALGLLVSTLWKRPGFPGWLKAGLGAGMIGSFTTFSAFAVALVAEVDHGLFGLAILYFAATMILGFAAAAAGVHLGGRRPGGAHDDADLADE